jgi:hypothetical protein
MLFMLLAMASGGGLGQAVSGVHGHDNGVLRGWCAAFGGAPRLAANPPIIDQLPGGGQVLASGTLEYFHRQGKPTRP